jgi:mannosyltransferase OCH1-like enzyme
MATEILKRHKSPGIDSITAELIKAGGRTFHSEIHKVINSVWNKEKLPEQWKKYIIVCTCL